MLCVGIADSADQEREMGLGLVWKDVRYYCTASGRKKPEFPGADHRDMGSEFAEREHRNLTQAAHTPVVQMGSVLRPLAGAWRVRRAGPTSRFGKLAGSQCNSSLASSSVPQSRTPFKTLKQPTQYAVELLRQVSRRSKTCTVPCAASFHQVPVDQPPCLLQHPVTRARL